MVAHFGSLAMLTAWLLNVDLDQALKIVLQRGQCGLIQAGHLRWWGFPMSESEIVSTLSKLKPRQHQNRGVNYGGCCC